MEFNFLPNSKKNSDLREREEKDQPTNRHDTRPWEVSIPIEREREGESEREREW